MCDFNRFSKWLTNCDEIVTNWALNLSYVIFLVRSFGHEAGYHELISIGVTNFQTLQR